MHQFQACIAFFVILHGAGTLAIVLVDFENPVRSSAEDEIKSLPHLAEPITFRQYSGYLKADKDGLKFLHYWFIEATEQPADKPVLVWLNGGPGCSSLEGLFRELGPFEIDGNGTEVKLRQYTWNKLANVLFLESPAGVGYSYSKRYFCYEDDDTAASENLRSLRSFYEKFPNFRKNPLFLSGESYAGIYLPTLAVLLDAEEDINLRGVAIGNGYMDALKLRESQVYFAYHHGLLGKTIWDQLSAKCCNGKPPARENCVLGGRQMAQDCARDVLTSIDNQLSVPGLCADNIYAPCPAGGRACGQLTRPMIDAQLNKIIGSQCDGLQSRVQLFDFQKDYSTKGSAASLCNQADGLTKYLNDKQVRNSLHIPNQLGSWTVCGYINYTIVYPLQPDGIAPQMIELINSKRNLTMLVFNGDTDLVCNSLGNEWFVDALGRKVIVDYAPWKVDKQVAGWVKHYDGISFATVRGAGHRVPESRPKEVFDLMGALLSSMGASVRL